MCATSYWQLYRRGTWQPTSRQGSKPHTVNLFNFETFARQIFPKNKTPQKFGMTIIRSKILSFLKTVHISMDSL